MRKKSLLALLCLMIIGKAFSQDLTFATFNCEFLIESKVHMKYGLSYSIKDEPSDVQNQWTYDYRKSKFNEATIAVAEHIQKINADVIGLTEVGRRLDVQLLSEKLKELKAGYEYYELGKSSDPTGQHVAVFSKYPLKMVQEQLEGRVIYFPESDLDEEKDTGLSKGMHVQVDAKGKQFDLFVVHFKSERGGNESDQQRVAQAELVRRSLIPLLNDPSKYVVVMGDLNSEKRHEVLMKVRGFDDIHPEMLQTGNDDFFADYTTRWTYIYKGVQEQIDHILLSSNFNQLCSRNYPPDRWGIKTSIIETNNPLVSDHNAMKVELYFR